MTYFVELPSVVITVVDADLTAEDSCVTADGEVIWHEGTAIGL